MPQIYDMGPTVLLPLRRKALKNPTASAGFEPANLGTEGQHANPRPPKPLTNTCCIKMSGDWYLGVTFLRRNEVHADIHS
jgi:hypothetical protein